MSVETPKNKLESDGERLNVLSTTAPNETTTIKKDAIAKPTSIGVTERMNQTDGHKRNFNDTISKDGEKQFFQHKKIFVDKKLNMELLLQYSRQTLHEFFTLHSEKQRIPSRLFKEAKAIIFLSVVKGAICIGATLGSGIILARNDNKWSSPCAISLKGVQIGLNIGIERVSYILLLRDESAMKLFLGKEAWKIGTDLSVAAGPVGGDLNAELFVNDTLIMEPVHSYAMAKGAYIGVSLNSSLITVRDDWNEEFYGRKMNLSEILNNYANVPKSEGYSSLITDLDEHCQIN